MGYREDASADKAATDKFVLEDKNNRKRRIPTRHVYSCDKTGVILIENALQDLGHEPMNDRLKLLLAASKSADCNIKSC